MCWKKIESSKKYNSFISRFSLKPKSLLGTAYCTSFVGVTMPRLSPSENMTPGISILPISLTSSVSLSTTISSPLSVPDLFRRKYNLSWKKIYENTKLFNIISGIVCNTKNYHHHQPVPNQASQFYLGKSQVYERKCVL